MNINSIKQSLNQATSQPLFELLKFISDKNIEGMLNKMPSDIVVTTISDYICNIDALPIREVRLTNNEYNIVLRYENIVDEPLELKSLNRLFLVWSEKGDVDIINLNNILFEMDDVDVKKKILEVMRFYSNLATSKHSIRTRYENFFDEGDHISALRVTIDKEVYSQVAKRELLDDDDDEDYYSTKYSRFLLLSKFINRLVEDDEFSEI